MSFWVFSNLVYQYFLTIIYYLITYESIDAHL